MWDSQAIRWQTFVQDTHTQVNDCENFEYLNIKGSAHYKDIETNVSPQIQDLDHVRQHVNFVHRQTDSQKYHTHSHPLTEHTESHHNASSPHTAQNEASR